MKRIKWLSLLISAVIMMGLIPTIVFAAGAEASANGVEYPTLQEALAAGGNIKLLQNVTVDSVITINKSVTLDLGDYTITNNVQKDRPFHVSADNFTVNADKGGMIIPQSNTGAYGFIKVNAVKNFTINGGTYTGNTDNGAFFKLYEGADGSTNVLNNVTATTNTEVFNTGVTLSTISVKATGGTYRVGTRAFFIDVIDCKDSPLIFEGVTVTADRGPCVDLSGGNSVFSACNFTVTGNFEGGYSWSRTAIGLAFEGNATIKSGTYSAKSDAMAANEGYGVYIFTSGGTLTVEGGTFIGTTAALRADVDKGTYGKPSEINVSGGNFQGYLLAITNTGLEKINITGGEFTGITEKTLAGGNKLSVSGGTFDNSVKAFVTDGLNFELSNSGEYTYHATIEDALTQAGSGAIITPTGNLDSGDNALKATLNYNNGSGISVQLLAGTDGTITLPSISRSGYVFLGWDAGDSKPMAAGQVYQLAEDTILTGAWRQLEKVKTDALEATCTRPGNIAYWYCAELNAYFKDEALTEKIKLEDTVIPAIPHSYQNGKCSVCGAADPDYSNSSQTGDTSNLWLWAALVSCGGMIILTRSRKKANR